MKLFGWELRREVMQAVPEGKQVQFETVLQRLMAARDSIGDVTPENCEQAPTVKAIITAITRRFAVTPVHVYQKGESRGRETKEKLANHPVARLLARPNSFQTRVDYWQDASSWIARYGRYHAYKSRGSTGPIRELLPMHPRDVEPKQDRDTWAVTYRWGHGAEMVEYPASKVHSVRGPSRNGYFGVSPVEDVRRAIWLEIAAEQFGSTFFDNGALPLLVWTYAAGSLGLKDKESEKSYLDSIQQALGGKNRHRNLIMPKGFDKPTAVQIENDKSQFLETRKYQRTVIAGAWGVPPHLVGDLERATFNNVEQQDGDFTLNVIMPIAQAFEAAMERDLLTDDDRASGVIIRFNLDSILRADFKSRQEGLRVQRDAGVISANEWREIEGKNPISEDDGGDDYMRPGNMLVAGEPPPETDKPAPAHPDMEAEAEEAAEKFLAGLTSLRSEIKAAQKEPPAPQIFNLTNNITSNTENRTEFPDIKISPAIVDMTVHPSPVEIKAPVTVNVEPALVTVKPSDVTVNSATPTVNIKNEMQPTPVRVDVAATTVNVEQPDVNITNEVKSPDVHVAAPIVNVEQPVVNVEAPDVKIQNVVPVPEVNIEPATVNVENHVDVPSVHVENKVDVPDVTVEAPTVNVAAPIVNVKNDLPEYETVESEPVRDAKGRVIKITTKRKRKV